MYLRLPRLLQIFQYYSVPILSGLLIILLMLVVFASAMLTAHRTHRDARARFNFRHEVGIDRGFFYIALFLMIARFWDYEIFVVPRVIPALKF